MKYFVKRLMDIVMSLVAIVVLSPLLLLLIILIPLDSKGSPFFLQERAGKNGKPFTVFKFRTMVVNAMAMGLEQGITQDKFGVVKNDPRITRVGNLLRITSLDELPQLFNIFLGHMSLVGPRPDVTEQVANYTDHERRRLEEKPGLTGWAQVNGRSSLSWPERIELDIWYCENWSLWLDLKIILRTFGVLFQKEQVFMEGEDTFNINRGQKLNQ